jgi:hypothetical protein
MSEMKTIYQAMAAILADIDFIGKDRKADMGNAGKYNFRGIDDIYNALHSSFAKHKVFIIPKILDREFEMQEKEKTYNGSTTKSYSYSAILTIEFTFVSEDGSMISAIGIGHALDTSDKATNKAQSAALKYCLMQTFLIPTEESKDVEEDNIQISATVSAPKPASVATAKPKTYIPDRPVPSYVPDRPTIPVTMPDRQVEEFSDTASQYLADLTKVFDQLKWEKTKKAGWAKTINPAPFGQWSDSDWSKAISKAYEELDRISQPQ